MLLGGDEFMRSQEGNNNAYCQDNAISWFDWSNLEKNSDIFAFFRKAIAFTRKYTVLQNRKFLAGVDEDGNKMPDISWFGPDGGRALWRIQRLASSVICSTEQRRLPNWATISSISS